MSTEELQTEELQTAREKIGEIVQKMDVFAERKDFSAEISQEDKVKWTAVRDEFETIQQTIKDTELKDIATATQAVAHAKMHLESLIKELGDKASPELKAALQDVGKQTVNTAAEASTALTAAAKAETSANAAEGAELQKLGMGAAMGAAGLMDRETLQGIVAWNGDGQGAQLASRAQLFESLENGINQFVQRSNEISA